MDIQNHIVTLIFIGTIYAALLHINKNVGRNTGEEKETNLTKKTATGITAEAAIKQGCL